MLVRILTKKLAKSYVFLPHATPLLRSPHTRDRRAGTLDEEEAHKPIAAVDGYAKKSSSAARSPLPADAAFLPLPTEPFFLPEAPFVAVAVGGVVAA